MIAKYTVKNEYMYIKRCQFFYLLSSQALLLNHGLQFSKSEHTLKLLSTKAMYMYPLLPGGKSMVSVLRKVASLNACLWSDD